MQMAHQVGPLKNLGPRTGNEPGSRKRGPSPPCSVAKVPRPALSCGAGRGFPTGPWKIPGLMCPGANAIVDAMKIGNTGAYRLAELKGTMLEEYFLRHWVTSFLAWW